MSGITYSILINWSCRISFFCSLFLSITLNAQVVQPVRYEVELENENEQYNLAPAGNEGLIIFRNKIIDSGKYALWEFRNLDSNLNEKWSKQILLDPGLRYDRECYNKEYAFFLFKKAGTFNLIVFYFNLETGAQGNFLINNHVPVDISEFKLTQHGVLVGGSYNSRPLVLFYSFNLSRSFFLANIYSAEGTLNDISSDDEGNIEILTSGIDHLKRKCLYLHSFDKNGQALDLNLLYSSSSKMSLQTGKILRMNGHMFITGTYGRKKSEYSYGIFIANFEEEEVRLKFYNYADLPNFFSHLKEKRTERIRMRIARRRDAGKQVNYKYRLKINDIIRSDNQYILIGESYYPKYRSYNIYQTQYNSYSRSNPLLFDGYYYSHAIVFGINQRGEITWNNNIGIKDIKRQTLDKIVNVAVDDSKVIMAYSFQNELRSKVIRRNEVIEETNSLEIGLKYASDELKSNFRHEEGGVLRAGDNVLYAYGKQKIKNGKDSGVKYNRDVFFINKVIYK